MTGTALDARYGRSRGRHRRGLAVAIVAGALVAAFALVWLFAWSGVFSPNSSIDAEQVGFRTAVRSTQVTSTVSAPTGHAVACSVEALDNNQDIVGWTIIHLPASDRETRGVTTEVLTTVRAASGQIDECWLD